MKTNINEIEIKNGKGSMNQTVVAWKDRQSWYTLSQS